ncbi:DUF86 domain-containing protein [Flammeovirga pectinis]|uniref:DUF86 domain-containing protein n=1 Tax=Flammeovirga pectinis TaxID=2494373 RepID=A0A3S9P058_9BACT|nr:HepT-like ribonuclease domain-containing protein [Flammeovirga pectinis]AZQ61562.1 DUF86 domain-containing protein [Flammeovirga pectinis]
MDNKTLKWLFDIKIAIEEIESYFSDIPKDFFVYRENIMLKRAIERDLEIIGEAMNRIIKSTPLIQDQITSAKSVIGLRNQVIHAYDNISDEMIWSVLIKHLPILKKEIEVLINDFNISKK